MSSQSSIRTAVLHSAYGNRASYYDDWLDAFILADSFDVTSFNLAQRKERKAFIKVVKSFDVIIALHSTNADSLTYAFDIKLALQIRKGILLFLVGNELNLPGLPIKLKIDYLNDVRPEFIGTQLLQESGEYLYSSTGAKIVALPHALNPRAFMPISKITHRPIDIGMRTFNYPSTFLGDEDRNRLLQLFLDNPFSPKLEIDIATNKRLNRAGWAHFLNQCKGTIANEAGGYWLEKDDNTILEIKKWLKLRYGGGITIKSTSPLNRLAHKLPWSFRQKLIKLLSGNLIRHEALLGDKVDFEEVFELFFASKPWPPKVTGKCVSSRHFEAAGTKTCQIMIEGRYNDILRANEHYIPLKRDLSNADEAIQKFCDFDFRQAIVERTYQYVMNFHTYKHRINLVEELLRSAKV